jgi:hypothetical protein
MSPTSNFLYIIYGKNDQKSSHKSLGDNDLGGRVTCCFYWTYERSFLKKVKKSEKK